MSEVAVLEQLQKKRTELEDEWASLAQKERTLEEKIKALEEKLAAQLEEKIKAKNSVLERMESTKTDLEKRLKELQENPEPSQMPKVPAPETAEKDEELQKLLMEATVKTSASDRQQPQNEEIKERGKEEKKRKWY